MNFYKVVGQITAKTVSFLKVIGFKNIKNFTINFYQVDINLKNGNIARIKYYTPGTNFVTWTVQDFIQQAMNEQKENWENYFDESKFQVALDLMIYKHDASVGINWDVVSYYLNEYCKK